MLHTLNPIEARRTLGDIQFTVACIPPDIHGGWSLKEIYSQEALDSNPAFKTRLGAVLARYTGSTVYAPSVGYHSGEIVAHARQLTQRITFPNGITMYRNKQVRADGVFVKSGQSFVMSGAGCMPAVAAGTNDDNQSFMLPFHVSRDSALDRSLVLGNGPSRSHRSVVEAAIDAMGERGVTPDRIAIRGYFSLPKACFEHPFEHPVHGEYNRRMADCVSKYWGNDCVSVEDTDDGRSAFLDMPSLLVQQADRLGVKDVKCEHTLKLSGPFAHTRHPDERLRTERNLSIVHRSR